MAQHGGARPGSGRKPGKVSKAKRELAEMAKDHAAMALRTLAEISESGESEAARVSAATAILDRAYGKPAQAMIHTGADGGPIEHAHQISDETLAAIATGRSPRATPQTGR